MTGLDVLLLEKTAFPREKVCGDGLTPRAVTRADHPRHPHARGGRLDPQPRPAHHRRRHAAVPAVAGPRRASRRTAWSAPGRTSTTSSPGTPSSTARACASAPTSPARCWTTAPAPSSASPPSWSTTTGAATGAERDLPGAAGRGGRRQLQPPVAVDGPAKARRPADGRRRAHLLHEPAPRRRLPRVVAGAVEHQRGGQEDPAARLRLDLRRRRRHQQRRPGHPQHLQGRSARSTTGT